MARVTEGSHSLTCHPHVYPQVEWTIPAFTPQPQSVTMLWPVLIFHPTEDIMAELVWVPCYKLRWFTRPQMVIHTSTNRARRRLTSLIKTNALPLSQATKRWRVQINVFILSDVLTISFGILCPAACLLLAYWLVQHFLDVFWHGYSFSW